MIVTAGRANVSIYVYFVDDVSGTNTGEPTTGLLFSDIETGGSASYVRQGAARVDFTLITLASASAVHADGGFILVDNTNMPGLYRLDVPDAAFVTGIDQVFIQLKAASGKNTVMHPVQVDITDVDFRNAASGGMSNLDAVLTARTLPAASYFDPAADTVAIVTAVSNGVTLATDAITDAKIADGAFLAEHFGANSLDSKGDWNTTTPPTVQQIEDEVWNALQSAHTTVDTMGSIATELALIDTATMRGTDSANTTTPPTVGAIADQVWEEAQADHIGATSFGAIATEIALIPTTAMRGTENAATATNLTTMQGDVDKIPKSDGTVVWNATAQTTIQTKARAAIDAFDPPTRTEATSDKAEIITDLDDIKGTGFVKDTHSLFDIEGYVDLIDDGTSGLAKIATDAAAVLIDTGTTLDGKLNTIGTTTTNIETDTQDLQTQIGTDGAGLTNMPWNAAWDAEVQSEVDDALDTVIVELGQAIPAITPTLRTAIMLIYMSLRNKIDVDATTKEIHNNAGTMIAQKVLSDDNTTYTEAKMISGV